MSSGRWDIAAAEKKGRAVMFAVQSLRYDDAYKMASELSDFEAALLCWVRA